MATSIGSLKLTSTWRLKFLLNSLLSRHYMRSGLSIWTTLFKDDKEMAINGFISAGITEAIENAKDMVEKVENPFKEVWF